jgi:hypothetical protein
VEIHRKSCLKRGIRAERNRFAIGIILAQTMV